MCEIADWIIMLFLLVAGGIDLKRKVVPHMLILKMTICVIISRIFMVEVSLAATVGGVLLGCFFFLTAKVTKEAIGYGDCWIILLLGIYKGGFVTLQIILTASMISALAALGCLVRSGWKQKYVIPFVPFLAAAYLGVVIL